MSLHELAQQAAKADADNRRQNAAAERERAVQKAAAKIESDYGFPAVYDGRRTLATLEWRSASGWGGRSSEQVVENTVCDVFRVDDVLLTRVPERGGSSHMTFRLVRDSQDGQYIAEGHLWGAYGKPEDKTPERAREAFVKSLGQAMSMDRGHPAAVLRAKNAACPTCHREW